MRQFILTLVLLIGLDQNMIAQKHRKKNIPYISEEASHFSSERHRLDVFYPRKTITKKNVFVFIHGGNWRSGSKNTYWPLGRILSKKGFVTVIINYRLAPEFQYDEMVNDCQDAVRWIKENIEKYGGDPDKITLAGHSAGGHLAAMVALKGEPSVKKVILNDAFGLDMAEYLKTYKERSYYSVFTTNREQWKAGSPIYYVENGPRVPFLIFRGERTHREIYERSLIFYNKVKANGNPATFYTIKRKKHVPMVTQLIFPWSKMYDKMTKFILTDHE